MKNSYKIYGLIALIVVAMVFLAIVILNPKPVRVLQTNVQPKGQTTGNQVIQIDNLSIGQTISLPFTATGIVQGWFFEGSFPVFIKDANGNTLGYGLAHSSQNWMTSTPIPFSVTLPAVNYTGPATLVFTKDNPSGESRFDASFDVPIIIQ